MIIGGASGAAVEEKTIYFDLDEENGHVAFVGDKKDTVVSLIHYYSVVL